MPNNKYIVFKRTEWNDHIHPPEIEDAVVIRRQDIFAAPALHSYANAMAVALELLPQGPERDNLRNVADYFHDQAVIAEATDYKKLPD